MKKFLSFILTLCAAFALGGLISNSVVNAKSPMTSPYTHTFAEGDLRSQRNFINGVEWYLDSDTRYFGWDSTNFKGVQVGKAAEPASYIKLSTREIIGDIAKITINTSGAVDINGSLSVSVGGQALGETVTLTKDATDYTFENLNQPKSHGEILLSYKQTSKKAFYIKSMTIEFVLGTFYTTSFYENDGTETVTPVQSLEGYEVKLPKPHHRIGFNFIGWFDAAEGGNPITKGYTQAANNDAKFYAQWKQVPIFTVSFETNGGKPLEPIRKINLNSKINLTSPFYDKHVFMGWYKDPELTVIFDDSKELIVEDITLYAKWFDISNTLTVEEIAPIMKNPNADYENVSVEGVVSKITYDRNNPDLIFKFEIKDNLSGTTKVGVFASKNTVVQEANVHVGDRFIISGIIDAKFGTVSKITSMNQIYKFEDVQTKASLKVAYDSNRVATDVDLRIGTRIPAALYDANAKYYVVVYEQNHKPEGGTMPSIDELVKNGHAKECVPVRVDAQGNASETGEFYQFAWVITNMEGHYTTMLTGGILMTKDNQVIGATQQALTSVKTVVDEYLNSDLVTPEVKEILKSIKF